MKRIIFLLTFLLLSFTTFSQNLPDNWKCGLDDANLPLTNYSWKPYQTPTYLQPFKILIVYVRFANDNATPQYDDFWWPPNEKPTNPSGLPLLASQDVPYNQNFMNMYPEYTISDYFCEMSMGKFDVTGNEVMVNLEEDDTYYENNYHNRAAFNQHILEEYVDNEINFEDYDNWQFDENTNEWFWGEDGNVDMIVMCYRNFPNGSAWAMGGAFSGWSSLACNLLLDGKNINGWYGYTGSGVTVLGGLLNYSNVTGVIQHEISHYLLNSNTTNGFHGSSGLMTGLDEMSFCMNPVERSLGYMGWTSPTDVWGDGIYEYTLSDYIKSGQFLKIILPTGYESFYVLNSQRISKYDGIIRGGNDNWITNKGQQNPYCATGKGLYIYHHSNPSLTTYEFCDPIPPNSQVYLQKEFQLENAEGKYNWSKVRDVNYYVPGNSFTIPLFEPTSGNVNTGKEEYQHWIKLPNACMQKEVTDDPCNMSEDANDYIVTIDDGGDEKDAFNYNIDRIFSPYSNPSTHGNLYPYTLNPLTICITGEDPINGTISVKIYWNREDNALQDLPPSKPKNIKVSKHVIEPISGRFQPKITWDPNSEPDFEDGGKYRIYRGIQYVCDKEVEPTYSYIGEVNAGTEEFIDYSIYLYPRSGGSGICQYQFRSMSYKIEAIDNSNKISLKSDRSIINGYAAPCDPVDGNNSSNNEGLPQVFKIYNYPNPFNPVTQIKYEIPQNTFVTVIVYNILGEIVKTLVNHEYMTSGKYSVLFDGSDLASGIYYYSIVAGVYKDVKKMVLLK